jgi:dihydropteroate synthase
MLGTPDIMQNAPNYESVLGDIKKFFTDRIELAEKAGIKTSNIVLDPGIGFGKYLEHNLQIIANIDKFHELGCPLLLGTSRKSFIGLLDGSDVNQRMGGSIASVIAAHQKNVQIFRVHDVAETKQALNIFTAIQKHLV